MEELKSSRRAEFAKYIKDIRERRGLSKFKASVALGYRSDGVINQIEQGRAPIPVEKIHAIADLYGIELEELLDKLQECEPELYAKYVTLERAFFQRFTATMMRAGGILRPQLARHHLPFPDSLDAVGAKVGNIYYVNRDAGSSLLLIPPQYYQMQQMEFDFLPAAEPGRAQGILLFPVLDRAA